MNGLDKLEEIGAQKIFEKTHIAKKFVEDILKQKFSSMNKVQFFGFISILEREYSIDLHELQDAYRTSSTSTIEKGKEPFVVSEQTGETKPNINKKVYILVAILVVGALYFTFKADPSLTQASSDKQVEDVLVEQELNNSIIEQAKMNLGSLDKNTTKVVEEVMLEPTHTNKFEVIPRSKLWIGIVDMQTFKRKQKMTSSSFELDPEKNWLLVMGHGYVTFDVHGEEKRFKDENKVWFAFENGSLSKLTRSQFTKKNKGQSW